MRILVAAALAASLAAGTVSALAQTAPAPAAPAKPAKPAKCSTLKDEAACGARTDCSWTAPTGTATTGKCKKTPAAKKS